MATITQSDVREKVLIAVSDQIGDQQQSSAKLLELALLDSGLARLASTLAALPTDASIKNEVAAQQSAVDDILNEKAPATTLGGVLASLHGLRWTLQSAAATWLANNDITARDSAKLEVAVLELITRVRQLLGARPNVSAVMDDLAAMKNLRGGPADAVAFHDFHVLQLATKSVWLHAFDSSLKTAVEQLYHELVEAKDQLPVALPALDALRDVTDLRELMSGLGASIAQMGFQPLPAEVSAQFPGSEIKWAMLSPAQQAALIACAANINSGLLSKEGIEGWRAIGKSYLDHPAGALDRMSKLMLEIGAALNEPYAFDVYAPNTYNYGLLITYRQEWEPQEYQAGNLVATIPLAPGETRKFSKRQVVKETVSRKIAERSSSLRSIQSSETSRAESEIMERATNTTNFKMTSNGSFNIGIGSMSVTNEFGGNNESFSSSNRKAFREATVKAAEEHRLERSVEVDATSSLEREESSSGEISNPNNEITVTYLFYELQRRYRIHEYLYRVQPVILVAQDVPEPQEIDEAWLVQYQWILARVLLDESFRAALNYLTSGFAGDEVGVGVLQAAWEKQKTLVNKLEQYTASQLATRNVLRETIVGQTLNKDLIDASQDGWQLIEKGLDSVAHGDLLFSNIAKADWDAETLEANRAAAETRLKYVEEALADAQGKLAAATSAFEASTKVYTQAMQNKYVRHIAIDQLRIHVKQNILYYMQAIYAHEVPDQRYFRLHKLPVACPDPKATFVVTGRRPISKGRAPVWVKGTASANPSAGTPADHELGVIADLDNPLGFKGNYIIFPLLEECAITRFMKTDFVDGYLGLKDPDPSAPSNFDAADFDQRWNDAYGNQAERDKLKAELVDYLETVRQSSEEIIVSTGNLFIEALPGAHPLLEDFKLLHRMEDVRKVKSEIRQIELENIRLASRLVEGQSDSDLLEDPKIDKKIVVEGEITKA